MLTGKTTEKFLRALEKLQYGSLELQLPCGEVYYFTGKELGPSAHLHLHQESVIGNMLLGGDIAFADDYRQGLWDSRDIGSLVELAVRNEKSLERFLFGAVVSQWFTRVLYGFRQNSKAGSRKNIHAHYDLGNEFYRLWLDPTMSYSAGIFPESNIELRDAQLNKYDRILERISNNKGDVLEIGCGWGGFAERLADKREGVLTAVTISSAQHAYASSRLAERTGQVDVQLRDYRDISGKFSGIVSIEMFEAVGERYWRTYFDKLKSLLADQGKAVVQTITIDDAAFSKYRKTGDAIRSYIFPGGMLPSPSRFKASAHRSGLHVSDSYSFGLGYAMTLERWLENFDAALPHVRALGFDEPFIRLWRYYLSSCAGAFRAGKIDVMQLELEHA